MRGNARKQLPLTTVQINHQHAAEMEAMSVLLDEHHSIAERAGRDLCGKRRSDRGRTGMSGDQVVRIALLKCIHRATYRDLAFRLVDSAVFRRFARLPYGAPIKVATLQDNVKRLTPETWEEINKVVLLCAKAAGLESGKKTRTDCTVVDANIHAPSDNSLLWDCVRVLMRLLDSGKELAPSLSWDFEDVRKLAKRLSFAIEYPRGSKEAKEKKRSQAYRRLLELTETTKEQAIAAEVNLKTVVATGPLHAARIAAPCAELASYVAATLQVMDQTRRRVLEGEAVPATEKLVSIFERHTDIVIKAKRETLFGHKVCLTGGASSMILDCVIEEGNPADSTLVSRSLKRIAALYGEAPEQAAFDGAFASKANLEEAKSLGVKDAVFNKKCGLAVSEMASSAGVFKKLRNFRAGIEGCISTLKRAFNMDRCIWRGLEGFKSYVWSSVVSFNLVVLARHLVAES